MGSSSNEAEISAIVEAGGGKYIGVLKKIPEKTEMIVLFISRETKSTLGVPISRLTVEAVREQLAESNAAFGTCSIPEEAKFKGRSKNHEAQKMGLTERCAPACGHVLRSATSRADSDHRRNHRRSDRSVGRGSGESDGRS
jgi:hypothetical protein